MKWRQLIIHILTAIVQAEEISNPNLIFTNEQTDELNRDFFPHSPKTGHSETEKKTAMILASSSPRTPEMCGPSQSVTRGGILAGFVMDIRV